MTPLGRLDQGRSAAFRTLGVLAALVLALAAINLAADSALALAGAPAGLVAVVRGGGWYAVMASAAGCLCWGSWRVARSLAARDPHAV